MKSYAFILLNLLAASWLSSSYGQVLFGAEFTFTNPALIQASANSTKSRTSTHTKYLKKWHSIAVRQCGGWLKAGCEVRWSIDKHGDTFKVTFADGFWYQVAMDTNVLEVQTLHSTIETFRAKQTLLQERVFATALELGLSPHERLGGGHINIDEATGLNGNFLLYWNFLADIANHPELTFGIFGGHLGNAPPIAALDESSIAAFKDIFGTSQAESDAKYAAFLILDDSYESRVRRLTELIQKRVYTSNPYGWKPFYYQLLRLTNMIYTFSNEGQRRIEMRNFRPQRSVDEFILQIQFLEAWLNHLRRLGSPLSVRIEANWDLPFEQKIESFLRVLGQLGLNQTEYLAGTPSCMRSLQTK